MNSLWFLIMVLLIIVLQNNIYRKYVFKNFFVNRSFSHKYLFPGDIGYLNITITNNKLLPITWTRLIQKIPKDIVLKDNTSVSELNKSKYIHKDLYILPFQRVKISYEIQFPTRGHYELIDEINIISTNLFNTKDYYSEIMCNSSVTVFPLVKEFKDSLIPANNINGEFFVERWIMEDPIMIKGIRDYISSDSLKTINWKATAKYDKLKVKEYDYTSEKKVMIFFDLGIPNNEFIEEKNPEIERAIELTASISTSIISDGIPVGITTNGTCRGYFDKIWLSPSANKSQSVKILDILGRIIYYRALSIEESLEFTINQLSWGADLLIITPQLTSELLDFLKGVLRNKVTVISLKENPEQLPSNIKLFVYNEKGDGYETN